MGVELNHGEVEMVLTLDDRFARIIDSALHTPGNHSRKSHAKTLISYQINANCGPHSDVPKASSCDFGMNKTFAACSLYQQDFETSILRSLDHLTQAHKFGMFRCNYLVIQLLFCTGRTLPLQNWLSMVSHCKRSPTHGASLRTDTQSNAWSQAIPMRITQTDCIESIGGQCRSSILRDHLLSISWDRSLMVAEVIRYSGALERMDGYYHKQPQMSHSKHVVCPLLAQDFIT